MKIDTLNTLLQEEIKDLYDAEKRLVRALPKMAKAANSEELRSAIQEHLDITRTQVERLDQVFELLDMKPKTKTCNGMKGIIEEGEETLQRDAEDALMDAAIIAAAQRVEHYEMAAYASARTIAEHLGNQEVADLLQQTWDEENEADEKLSQIAEDVLGSIQGRGEGGEEEEGRPARRTMGQKSAGARQS